jgi:hypothetical protein
LLLVELGVGCCSAAALWWWSQRHRHREKGNVTRFETAPTANNLIVIVMMMANTSVTNEVIELSSISC